MYYLWYIISTPEKKNYQRNLDKKDFEIFPAIMGSSLSLNNCNIKNGNTNTNINVSKKIKENLVFKRRYYHREIDHINSIGCSLSQNVVCIS